MKANDANSTPCGGLFWDIEYDIIEPVDFSPESPPTVSSGRWSLSQVSSTRPEATCSAVPHIKIDKAEVVYNIVVPNGEVGKVLAVLENQNPSDCGHTDKRRPRSPTKSTEDTGRYSTSRQDDREEYRRLQRRHYRRSEYSIRDSGHAHRSRARGWQDH